MNQKHLVRGSHEKAYVCIHVFEGSAPVMLVSRPDGDWCFLCGQTHDDKAASYRVIGIGHIIERDESLSILDDLNENYEAERGSMNGAWIRTPIDPNA